MIHCNRQTVVFISGFLTPTDWLSYPIDLVPENVNLISVYPSPTGSLHDRACQVFYELFGGTTDYGKEHSDFHNHERYGRTFQKGKLPVWNEDYPITIIGHSLGGCTAWVLQNYLAQGRFEGIHTSAAWVSNVICVSAPLNGAMQVHFRGKDMSHPPLVRWGSSGCIVGWCAQWAEFFDLDIIRTYMDFQQAHCRVSWRSAGALRRLFLSMLGYCLHSNTDNVAYDVTIKSQLEWAKVLLTFPHCRYISVVGQLIPAELPSRNQYGFINVCRSIIKMLRAEVSPRICGIDTSGWTARGSDGLLSVHTQEYPRLHEQVSYGKSKYVSEKNHFPQHRSSFLPKQHVLESEQVLLEPGVWHYTHHHMSHLNTAFGCNDTWGLLMRIVTHLDRQKRVARSPASTCQPSSYHTSRDAPQPDMQKVTFCFSHRESTSLGVAYRQRNLYYTIALMLVWWVCDSSTLNRSNWPFFGMCVVLSIVAMIFLLPRRADSSALRRTYFSNKKLLIADVAEVVYAMYRLLDTFNGTPAINESTLLCEVILQSLLPRPLLDYANPPRSVLVTVLLLFVPNVWRSIACTSISAAMMLFTVLPKLCWVVIYCNQREACVSWRVAARDIFVWSAVMLFLCGWLFYLNHLYTMYYTTSGSVESLVFSLTVVLLALYPLTKFQDLSMCIQMVLIEHHTTKSTQIS